ncbi:hypothetical protein DUI87_08392 [Hirundo rustica rustica]|uniref:Dysbindin n=1 Tax=Hirundo rustica rustica TaxID=333673 RepID=A0A3M0KSB0_HIRRU|nr:hypothetical protein DUI87_08392 [Hirundo rustica rustica]
MLETLRERLLSVQQDLTAGLKTLGDKSRDAKKSRQRYEDAWAALHKGAKDCAKAGELVDSEVVMLSAHWEKKRNSLVELQDQLQQIPGFLADLECLTASLAQLEASFEEMEDHLLCLEELCEQCELERYKRVQTLQLENYKKTKRKELETFKEVFVTKGDGFMNGDVVMPCGVACKFLRSVHQFQSWENCL